MSYPTLPAACIIPAAGAGVRFGQPKAEAEVAPGVRFLERVVARAVQAGARPVIAVVARGTAVPDPAIAVEGSSRGDQLSSIRRGLARLAGDPARCVLIWPVDHPFAESASARALLEAWERTGRPIVVPVHGGARGHPVLFAREIWLDLMTAEGGARTVVHRYAAHVHEAIVDDPGILRDVDTRADLMT